MKTILITLLLVFSLVGCGLLANKDKAVRALQDAGYSDIKITDRHVLFVGMRGCSDDDSVAFKATATNPIGKKVKVLVCAGWLLKGATIRTR